MKQKFTPLLAILFVGIALVAIVGGYVNTTAVSPRARPNLPSGVFVARVYYEDLEDLSALSAYDLWEYNNLKEGYVLVSLDGHEFLHLAQIGWRLEVDHEHTALLSSGASSILSGYRTVEEIYASLAQLDNQYPHLTELVTYGQSTCLARGGCTTLGGEYFPGHELLALRVSNEDIPGVSTVNNSVISRGTKPIFILLANIHAREIATPEIAMRFVDHLMTNYGHDADVTWLVDQHELWIIPTANPDGHWLVELGTSPTYTQGAFYQRKNANLDADYNGVPDCSVWPPEISWQYGVDLNRNHSYAWGEVGSSGDSCSQTFRGPEPASEPETDSLQALIKTLIPDQRGDGVQDAAPQSTTGLLLTLHSFGDLILWPWGNTALPAPNQAGLKAIGDKLAAYNGYRSCQGSICLYAASGTTDDWAYGELGIPAFTYEIGDWFMPEYSEIDEYLWPQNLPSLLYAARIARTPYETILGPDVYDVRSVISAQEDSMI